MKKFVRSIPGKIILSALCIITTLGTLISVICAYILVDTNAYSRNQGEYLSRILSYDFCNRAVADMETAAKGLPESIDRNYSFEIRDEKGYSVLTYLLDSSSLSGHIIMTGNTSASLKNGTPEKLIDSDAALQSWDMVIPVYISGDYDYYTPYQSYLRSSDSKDAFKSYFLALRMDGIGYDDPVVLSYKALQILYTLKYAIYPLGLLLGGIALACFITLMCVAGRHPDSEDLYPGYFHHVPSDVLLAGLLLGYCITVGFISELGNLFCFLMSLVLIMLDLIASIAYAMHVVVCIKDKNLFHDTLTASFFRKITKLAQQAITLFQNIPVIWKTLLLTGAISFAEFVLLLLCIMNCSLDLLLVFWFLEKLILIPAVLFMSLRFHRLREAAHKLASGDLNYQLNTSGMQGDFKRHADDLNHISQGIATAVNEQLKSERMKTELITNVSHDLKTPLTSIINYAGLIAKESAANPTLQEYSEVCMRQSKKLNRLLEDLVEASKAASGNLEVLLAPCNPSIFLNQVSGEYEEKLAASNLTLIVKQPEEEYLILADGRRMWRIFDNLMNNICKYAQPGTRVYLSLEATIKDVTISFKNTSKQELDMSPEELMERFVRGDHSRNTEGNGLGLSIAQSMAELQKGTLTLSVDGDLFKAVLTFPRI